MSEWELWNVTSCLPLNHCSSFYKISISSVPFTRICSSIAIGSPARWVPVFLKTLVLCMSFLATPITNKTLLVMVVELRVPLILLLRFLNCISLACKNSRINSNIMTKASSIRFLLLSLKYSGENFVNGRQWLHQEYVILDRNKAIIQTVKKLHNIIFMLKRGNGNESTTFASRSTFTRRKGSKLHQFSPKSLQLSKVGRDRIGTLCKSTNL